MLKTSFSTSNLVVGGKPVHYAWVIVAVASLMWVITGSMRFAVVQLVPFLHDPNGFGWSYFAITLAFTVQWLLSGALSPVVGWLGDRYGVRRVLGFGTGLFVLGMILTGIMTHLWEFLIYFGVILGAAIAIFQVSVITGVTLWFKKRLGVAMGSLQGFQGFGTVIALLLVMVLFNSFGFKWTFWVPGIVGGAMLFMLSRFFHNEPAVIGLKPLGASETEPVRRMQNNETSKVRTKVFLKHAKKTSAFWNLVGIHFWGCAGHNVILILLVAMAVENGLSQGMAVGVYIVMTGVSTVTRFAVPVISDRVGSKWAMGVCKCVGGSGTSTSLPSGCFGVARSRRPFPGSARSVPSVP